MRFRLKVRQYALATPGATGEARRQQLQERQPLLEACDALRQDLATHGINIKVSNTANAGNTNVTRQRPAIQFLREMADAETWEAGYISCKNCQTPPMRARSWLPLLESHFYLQLHFLTCLL